jgi:tight adherence protein C
MTDVFAGALTSNGWSWLGAALGGMLATGGLLFLVGLPANRRPGLEARLAPYLRDTARPSRLLAISRDTSGPGQLLILRPVIRDLGRGVEQMLGGATSVRRRMERAGHRPDVESFRAEQVVWGVGGGAIGLLVATLMWLKDGGSIIPLVLLVVCAVGVGIVACDQLLTRSANKREQQMLAEFPTVAELLALAVGAGEGATGAECDTLPGVADASLSICATAPRPRRCTQNVLSMSTDAHYQPTLPTVYLQVRAVLPASLQVRGVAE